MAISDPGMRFSFDFDDLRRAPPTSEFSLVRPRLESLPAGAAATARHARPRWLPSVLPVFRACEPLRVSVLGAEAPVWASRLRSSLAGLLASAGGRADLQVAEWHDGFAVGATGFDRVPVVPHAVVVGAELDPTSMRAAALLMLSLEQEGCFLVVQGDEPAPDRPIALDATRVVRFPVLGRSELAALARGVPPGLTNGPFGRACLGLARTIVARYRQLER